MKNLRQICQNSLYLCIVGLAILLLLNRVQYGIDLTDETWYVAEPYVVAQGAVPYVDNWSQTPGFTIPLFLIMKLFLACNNGTEGIFLFSRFVYVCWSLTIITVSWWLLKRSLQNKLPIIAIAPLIFYCPHNLYYINYNTIGIWYLLLSGVILLGGEQNETQKNDLCRGFFGGVLIARAVIGTPAVVIPCLGLCILLAVYRKKYRLLGYIGGGCLTALLVIIVCSVKGGGISQLLQGLEYLLKDGGYFKLSSQLTAKQCWKYLYEFLEPFLVGTVLTVGCFLILRKHEQLYRNFFSVIVILFGGIGLIKGFSDYKFFISYTWFWGLLIFFSLPKERRKQFNIQFLFDVMILYIAMYIFSCMTNHYKVIGREYFLFIPCVLTYIMLYQVMDWYKVKEAIFCILSIGAMCVMINNSYGYIYRDDIVENLDTRVQQGIWKGCYTTKARATMVETLEKEIKEVTTSEDRVLFLDWVSFGYLMSNGQPYTPSALDNMLYSYKVNNAEIMYDYFAAKGEIPNKIIYVDFGRDNQLSIEDEQWKFNDFVNCFFELETEWKSEEYRVLCYSYTGE